MKGFLRRFIEGLVYMSVFALAFTIWLVIPSWLIIAFPNLWVIIACLAWMILCLVAGFAALDNEGPPNLVLRRPPKPPNNHRRT